MQQPDAKQEQEQQRQQQRPCSSWQHKPPGARARSLAARSLAAALAAAHVLAAAAPPPAAALLSSPGAQVPRSPEAALRRATPAFNADVQTLQRRMENIAFLLRIPQRKPWGSMAADVSESLKLFEDRQRLLAGVPAAQLAAGNALLDGAEARLKQLELAVKTQQPDYVGVRVADVLKAVSRLEVLQAPGLPYSLPKEVLSLPRLVGRATVRLTVEKGDGSLAFLDPKAGGVTGRGVIELTLDGYSAPVSAGNFAANVLDGLYDGRPVQASRVSVITSATAARQRPPIPLEIMPAGEFEPLYRLPLDVQGGEYPVLPLSISGAVSMTHTPDSDVLLSGDEWFIFKFDKQQAGLAGLSFDEGRFGVFAYVTEGMDAVVPRLETGDLIVKAEVVEGADKLVRPGGGGGGVQLAAAPALGAQ
ncbi:MAG: cyclophilin-type peptidyl-prolyl cis-trans isomerase [Monoraphidium minutum]|nr:MAG: cyclophilin-type peptidyl-prolyl cis-trans isomerase [Monoraphidium minutum]